MGQKSDRDRRATDAPEQDYTDSRKQGEQYLVVDKKIAVPLYIVVILFIWLVPTTVTVVKFLHRFERIEAQLHAGRSPESEWHREQAKQQWENFKAANEAANVPDTKDVGYVSDDGEWAYPND